MATDEDPPPDAEADAAAEAKPDPKPDAKAKPVAKAKPPAPTPVEPADDHDVAAADHGSDAHLGPAVMVYPDDSPFAKTLRTVDNAVGLGEQILLFAILAAMVSIGTFAAISDKIFGKSYVWSYDLIRDGVFTIAMIGAAFATYQERNLSMDLVSRRLKPRGRLFLRVMLHLFTIFISALFLYAGYLLARKTEAGETAIAMWKIAAMIPVGAGLIIFHSILHLVVDVDYLVRGKLPPERERSAH